jgi:Tat protein translocase TatB subunit
VFGLGFTELLFIGLLALLLIGPEELPQVARMIGRFMNDIKRGSDSFKEELHQSARKLQDEIKVEPPELPDLTVKLDDKKDESAKHE